MKQAVGVLIVICASMPIHAGKTDDPLRRFVGSLNGETQLYTPHYDIDDIELDRSDRCTGDDFEEFDVPPSTSSSEAARLRRMAYEAVAKTGFRPCECRVRYVASPWRDFETFEVEHGFCWGLTVEVIAVGPDGLALTLSGDIWGAIEATGERRANALADFNALNSRNGVRFESAELARKRLEYFLRVYFPRVVAYLPSSAMARFVAAVPAGYPYDLPPAVYRELKVPVVDVVDRGPDGFEGRSYVWEPGSGRIEQIDLSMTTDGVVALSQERFATQERRSDDDP